MAGHFLFRCVFFLYFFFFSSRRRHTRCSRDWISDVCSSDLEAATEDVLGTVPDATTADIDRAVAAARKTFDSGEWTSTTPEQRAEIMAALSANIQGRYEDRKSVV